MLVVECADPPSGSCPTADTVWWMESMSLVTSGMHFPAVLHCPFPGRQSVLDKEGFTMLWRTSRVSEERVMVKVSVLEKRVLAGRNWHFIKICKVISHSIFSCLGVWKTLYTHFSPLTTYTSGIPLFSVSWIKIHGSTINLFAFHTLVENFIISTNK